MSRDPNRTLIKRDIHFSALAGPVRFVVPVAGYAVLYPMMLSRFGAAVLGIWSLIMAIPYAMTFVDIGFSQLLVREMARADDDRLESTHKKYLCVIRFYLLMGVVATLVSVPLTLLLMLTHPDVYDPVRVTVAVALMTISVALQLVAKLDAAILTGRSQNYYVQIAMGGAPIVLFGAAIAGTLADYPIIGSASGFLLSQILLIALLRQRQSRSVSAWNPRQYSVGFLEGITIFRGLLREGLHLYSMSIGLLIREPILRFSIAGILGLQASAVFEIAMRVARLPRDVFAAGFTSLFASFSVLHKEKDFGQLVSISQRSLIMLFIGGGVPLGLVSACLPWMFEIWLGPVDEQMVPATRILIAWCFITLFNIPFWYLLLATHRESVAAVSVWTHVVFVGGLSLLSLIIPLDLNLVLVYWTVTSLATQAVIYWAVHAQLRLLVPILRSFPVLIGIILTIGLLWIQTTFEGTVHDFPLHALLAAAAGGVVLVGCLYALNSQERRDMAEDR